MASWQRFTYKGRHYPVVTLVPLNLTINKDGWTLKAFHSNAKDL